jgi:hypothetical protein
MILKKGHNKSFEFGKFDYFLPLGQQEYRGGDAIISEEQISKAKMKDQTSDLTRDFPELACTKLRRKI